MSSIKDKLRGFKSSLTVPQTVHSEPESQVFCDVPDDARVFENKYGTFVIREKRFPLDFEHGLPLLTLLDITPDEFVLIGKDPALAGMKPESIIFLDTETTGLAGGTGTCPFMIGAGFFKDDAFIVRQFFMRDYHEEPAMLYDLAELLSEYSSIVSFNGKSYDLPLMRTRYILNRFEIPWEHYPHLDLVHASRRLWKESVGSCTLQSLEAAILGFHRHDDIPGFEIPAMYFNYLQRRDIAPLIPVFKHNVMDILSMVSLCAFISNAFSSIPEGPVFMGVLRTLESLGMFQQAIEKSDAYIALNDNQNLVPVFEARGYLLKKMARYSESIDAWQQVVNLSTRFHPQAHVELAKAYEHHIRDYQKAYDIVVHALEQLYLLSELHSTTFTAWLDDLEYRKQRLIKKLD